ncbi:ICOS ligand-like [Amphiprion ocellaris]|uniref:ICOS ligand-like n=1 Tax=Amphiprion ocellaris TaxID=80972 RepID=UPI002410F90B|nr:ICOS ligand-like [Amphiprion ocellaris]
MKAGTCMSFCLTVYLLVYTCTALTNMTTYVGENVTLPCQVPDNYKPFTGLECRRSPQNPKFVFVFRNKRFNQHDQDPSYKNRVDVQDKEMKDGNVSLILMNVTMEDNGEYECRVFQGTKNELICSIILEVHPPGDKVEIIGDGRDKDGGNKDGGDMVGLIVGPIGSVIVSLFL